jgi:hypothetical protein
MSRCVSYRALPHTRVIARAQPRVWVASTAQHGAPQVHDMEGLLPLFDRFMSPDATLYAVCIYKAR